MVWVLRTVVLLSEYHQGDPGGHSLSQDAGGGIRQRQLDHKGA
jgi:hypothetical protein